EAVEHLGQFSVGRTASTGSVFGQRQQGLRKKPFVPVISTENATLSGSIMPIMVPIFHVSH
ncbi:hypothetical protein, partial [Pseudomonas sp. o96-267]|uniref:hypothetical protein n=1 Tax=Pseudomonas sp. o96-267 TaxID=2479853 RepID=UPI001C49AFEC